MAEIQTPEYDSDLDRCIAEVEQVIGRRLMKPERAILIHGFTYGQRAGRREIEGRCR